MMEKRHRIRFTHSLLAASGGLVLCLIVAYAQMLGQVALGPGPLVVIFLVFWSVNAWFLWAVGSGYSDRYRDGSLTLPQMYWASLSCILTMVIVQGHYELLLLLLFLIMVFGIFRMNGKDFIVYSLVISVCFACQQTASFLLQNESVSSMDRLVMWFVFTMCVAVLTSLCNSVAIMRTRLHLKNEELQEALGTKNLFLANMSHEVRTPINGVIGMLRLLQRSPLNDQQRQQAVLALTSAQNLLSIVNDILDFSKIEAGQMALEQVEFDLLELITDIATSMGVRAQEKNLEFVLDVTNIPVAKVKGDPGRLHQVIMNLLGNAIKFTQHGEIVLKCQLSEADPGHYLFQCSVKDTGIGIAKENLNKIFSSFSQVDTSTTRRFGGAGLGLSLVKHLSQMMGGDVAINSAVGYGSEFTATATLAAVGELTAVSAPISLKHHHILIVDGNLSANNVLAKQFKSWGATVYQAFDHASAISILYDSLHDQGAQKTANQTFTTVFVDQHVENEEGVKLSITLRQEPEFAKVQIVLLTPIGEEVVTDPLASDRQQCDVQLFKPVTSNSLSRVLKSLTVSQWDSSSAVAQPQEALLSPTNKGKPLTVRSASRKILLVEDNEVNRLVAEGVLEEFGLTCDIAENGREALDQLNTSRTTGELYGLILMDCQMPVMDGYEATRQIRSGICGQEYRYIPIVAVTANVMAGDKEKCLNTGMNDFLPKPLDVDDVAQKLTQWLGNVRLISEDAVLQKAAIEQTAQEQATKEQATKEQATKEQAPLENHAAETFSDPVESTSRVPAEESVSVIWDEHSALRRVRGKKDRLINLIRLFIKNTPEELAQLHAAYEQQDYDAVRKGAHSLKGVAGNMGALQLMDIALMCEQCCTDKETRRDELVSAIPKLSNCFETTLQVLKQYLEKAEDAQ
ncbi:Signal transduction histidine-protein kinase BarA [Thalassocella blandensis]|nr:Signal transduction histidine-protein kinase BarA [Thalassocella blandensis]